MFRDPQAIWQWRDGVDQHGYRRSAAVGSMGVNGYDVEAADGHIGTVDESSGVLGVGCLVVNAADGNGGRQVLVPAGTVREVDRDARVVHLDRSTADVEQSPGIGSDNFVRPHHRDLIAYHFAGSYQRPPL